MQFINLDINIEPRRTDGYPVLVNSSKFGQARTICPLDVSDAELRADLEAIAGGQASRERLIIVGRRLASSLFNDEVETLFHKAVGAVQAQPKLGLRLRLRIEPPELSVLPWELLWLGTDLDPLSVSTRHVVTRYIELSAPVREMISPRPLRLLGIIPQGSGLNVEKEKKALEGAIAELGDSLQVLWLEGIVTIDRIREELGRTEYHLVHFIGHGAMKDGQATLRLNDEWGDDYPAIAETFAGLFRDSSVRLVLLNACKGAARSSADAFVGIAPQVARWGIPAVVAMQWDISDLVAQQFAAAFYRSLCIGPEAGEVDTAVTRGRAALYDDYRDSQAFATPVLFLRSEDGRLWGPWSGAKTESGTRVTIQRFGLVALAIVVALGLIFGADVLLPRPGQTTLEPPPTTAAAATVPVATPTPVSTPGPVLVTPEQDKPPYDCLRAGEAVLAVVYDGGNGRDEVWAGSTLGLARLDHKTDQWMCATLPPGFPLPVYALAVSPDGSVWAGGPGGLAHLDASGANTLAWYSAAGGLLNDDVRALATLDHRVWAGHFDSEGKSGLSVLELESEQWRQFQADGNDAISFSRVYALAPFTIDSQWAVWAATGQGLQRANSQNAWVERRVGSGLSGLPDDAVSALALASDGRLWVGTGNGLAILDDGSKLDASDDQWATVAPPQPGWNAVAAISLESHGPAWIGT
ncbi:MAG: CHAT domain-containing protein, partial [Chloroflexota bacterium]